MTSCALLAAFLLTMVTGAAGIQNLKKQTSIRAPAIRGPAPLVEPPQSLADVPKALASIFELSVREAGRHAGHSAASLSQFQQSVEALGDQYLKLKEGSGIQEINQLAKIVQAMFPESALNKTSLQEFKTRNPDLGMQFLESLMGKDSSVPSVPQLALVQTSADDANDKSKRSLFQVRQEGKGPFDRIVGEEDEVLHRKSHNAEHRGKKGTTILEGEHLFNGADSGTFRSTRGVGHKYMESYYEEEDNDACEGEDCKGSRFIAEGEEGSLAEEKKKERATVGYIPGPMPNMVKNLLQVAEARKVLEAVSETPGPMKLNFLCYFEDPAFPPCITFNVCMGAFTGASTLPSTYGKDIMAIPQALIGWKSSKFLFKKGASTCAMANSIVAPQADPLKGALWAVRKDLEKKVKSIR